MTAQPYDDADDEFDGVPAEIVPDDRPNRLDEWRAHREARREAAREVAAAASPPPLPGVLARAADHHVPTRERAVAVARVYVPPMLRAGAWSPLTLPVWLLRQCWYILRGLAAVMAARRDWIRQPERRAGLRVEGIDPTKREELRRDIEDRGAGRNRTWTLGVTVLTAGYAALWVWFPLPAAAVTLAALVRLDLLGRAPTGDEPAPEQPLRSSPVRAGVSLGALGAQIVEAGLALDVEIAVKRPRPFLRGEGFDVEVQTQDPLDGRTLRAFERRLQVPERSISVLVDSHDSSVRTMRITLTDPLADMPGRTDPEFDSLSVREPADCGLDDTGRPYRERFERSHVQIIGESGSGKSSALWRFLRLVASWYDATADGIDLTRGPAFSALRGVLDRRAFTYEDALDVLRDRKREAEARIARLGEIADSDDEQYDDADENHVPTADEPQRFIVIDEFHSFVTASAAQAARDGDKSSPGEGVELVEWFLRYSRKAAVNLVLSGQGSKATDFGTSTVRDLITIVILFACGPQDVLRTLGKDARDAGWRPDLLQPAQGQNIRDAGKCYTQSAENDDPHRRRWFRYSLGEVRRFAREYRRFIGDDSTGMQAAETAVVVPEVLAVIERLCVEHGVDRVPSELVATALGTTATLAAEQAREHGVSTRRLNSTLAGKSVRCYTLADARDAIRKCDAE
jgi:hypothetical protein